MFETYTCENCGKTFRSHPDSNAAESGFCSPSCYEVNR